MRYELTDLRLFLAIAQAKSLSTGACAVHITASSASYRLKNLEHALGTSLFVRNARGMELTPAGEAVLAHVRELFEGVERMHEDVGRFTSGLKGHVRLTANSSALNGFITPSLGRFLVLHPHVDADIEERQSETIPAAVLAREADIGIFAGETGVAGLDLHRYALDQLVIAVPPAHPLAREREIKLGAALDFEFVCMNRSSSNFLFLRDMAQKAGRQLRVRLHTHSFEAVLSLVEAGVGVALVPRSIIAIAPDARAITMLALAETWAARELNLVVRADARLPTFAKAFMQSLLDDPRVAVTPEPPASE
ncbi:LysR family transcriptional regulator [Verminephrobacter aporrectodeae]|uniref:LysR family transcriptional regulator n=1 Tax=Verminephrobacter aporrectodeae TaxID=1110389 RepID=UPI002244B6EF|nr:LysR family transcriptional regulator [Verminephrobacter aporrectodeae]MCW8176558.1 LysR family transcriptional regulator [Verminephrobacter aporrectodeae subsp. tuberculatae]MCW8203560.1 LysR family transcriptional regulator [Verminephrobacter aporrectodeae subsp. tuberculatae]